MTTTQTLDNIFGACVVQGTLKEAAKEMAAAAGAYPGSQVIKNIDAD